MKLSDKIGTLDTDPRHIKEFVSAWYKDTDRIVLVGMPPNAVGKRSVLSLATTKRDLMQITAEDVMNLSFYKEQSRRLNMYLGINPVSKDSEITLHSRGTKDDIARSIGLFADLDIKDGAFSTKTQIHNFLNSIPLKPTLVVDNGKMGGVHAYWKVREDDQKDNLINRDTMNAWWAYLSSLSPAAIDRLTDYTRISRMPSSIYWSRDGGSETDTVRVHTHNDVEYSIEEINELSAEHGEKYEEKVNNLRKQKLLYARSSLNENNEQQMEMIERMVEKSGGTFSGKNFFLKRQALEDKINREMDWSNILEPAGWTFRRELDGGSREFARPGQSDRSAEVDYVRDDGTVSPVMALHSLSEQTGLADLREAGIPLTKYQVLLRLHFKDNEVALVEHYANGVL